MLTTLVLAVLAVDEVHPLEAPEEPAWGLQLLVAAPSVLHASFGLSASTLGGLSGLGGISSVRPPLSGAFTVERRFGEHWTGAAQVMFVGAFAEASTFAGGGGVIGARWYPTRAFDGFFIGPEAIALVSNSEYRAAETTRMSSWGVGLAARAGWMQRFGAHFMASASAAVGANVTSSQAFDTRMQSVNVGLELALGAGLLF
ncbi:MAG: DUF3575 domain-containing protein [Archangium sp.]